MDVTMITLQEAAARTGLSVSYLRRHMHDPHRPLPHYHMGRAVRVRVVDLDAWRELFRDVSSSELDDLFERVQRDFR